MNSFGDAFLWWVGLASVCYALARVGIEAFCNLLLTYRTQKVKFESPSLSPTVPSLSDISDDVPF